MSGTAPDGGLYVPENLPHFDPAALTQIDTVSDLATQLLAPFFEGSALSDQLGEIVGAGSLGDALRAPGVNFFAAKLTYWFSMH